MSTMASSTTEPIATTRPPRVMVLISSPKARISIRPITSDRGMALRVITAVRQFIRNSTITTDTIRMPSIKEVLTFLIAVSMKLACRKVRVTSMSPGRVLLRAAIRASTSRVTLGVSMSGCLLIISTTAGLPLKLPSPRFRALASRTTATSPRRSAWPWLLVTTESARSSLLLAWPLARISFSCPPAIRKPPGALALAAAAASATACNDTWRA